MPKRNNSKPRKRKVNYSRLLGRMRKKLVVTFLIFCILSCGLIGRIIYINLANGEDYEKIVLAQQGYDSQIIPYQRGNITDSKGTVLATSVDVYNVILDCYVLNANEATDEDKDEEDKKHYVDTTVEAVTSTLPQIEESTMRDAIENNPDGTYTVLAKKISYDEMTALQTLIDNNDAIKGIWFEKEYVREYPYGSLAASVIGYTTSGSMGVIGLENEYDDVLNGTNGRSYSYINADNDIEQTVVDAEDGNTIVTTIDVNIQTIVEQAIEDFNYQMLVEREAEGGGIAEYATNITSEMQGSANTAVIVMNPNNGEVLAMANYPGFDLNDPRDLSDWFSEEALEAMTDEEQLEILNNIWNNFTISSTYEPGSTFKPFVVAAGLDTGTVTGDESYYCDGGETVDGYWIRCVKNSGHGLEDIQKVLSNSCNDAMMQMVRSIGADNFSEYQSRFGFGQLTGIDLPGEARTSSLLYSAEDLENTASSLATNAFGQNFNVTMIQMAAAFSSLVNGGTYYEPHLVSKIQDSQGNTVSTVDPLVTKKTVSEETSEQIKEYLKGVVESGSGKYAAVENYSVGGKTGTAEKTPRGNHNYLVSFIGAAPIENPEVVIYCIVDEANTNDQAHSSYAQSIVQNILTQILPYLDVDTVEEQAQAEAEAAAALAAESGVDLSETDDAAEATDTPDEVASE